MTESKKFLDLCTSWYNKTSVWFCISHNYRCYFSLQWGEIESSETLPLSSRNVPHRNLCSHCSRSLTVQWHTAAGLHLKHSEKILFCKHIKHYLKSLYLHCSVKMCSASASCWSSLACRWRSRCCYCSGVRKSYLHSCQWSQKMCNSGLDDGKTSIKGLNGFIWIYFLHKMANKSSHFRD